MKLTPIIFIVLAIGIFFLYVQPENEKLKQLEEESKQYIEAKEKANQLRTKREQLVNQFKEIGRGDQERLKKMLPATIDNVRLLLDLTNIAEDPELGISLSQISIGSAQEQGGEAGEQGGGRQQGRNNNSIVIDESGQGYGTIRIGFSFIATYDQYKKFLRKLELSLRLVDITQLSVKTSDGNLNSYSVGLETYWLR